MRRGVTATSGPPIRNSLAVVLIVAHPNDSPDAVLSALVSQSGDAEFEILVIDGRSSPASPDAASSFQDLHVISRPGLNMPRLKAEGLAASTRDLVAFLEPKGVPDLHWVANIFEQFADAEVDALGGRVEFASAPTAANLAAFLFEYAPFSDDAIRAGRTTDLPANNMVLRRDAIMDSCADILYKYGLNKPFCQKRMKSAGAKIRLSADLCVRLETQHDLWPLLKSRYFYARCFSGVRRAQANWPTRILLFVAAPSILLIVLIKRLRAASRAPGALLRLDVRMALIALCSAWALGEIAGCWFGTGRAEDRLR